MSDIVKARPIRCGDRVERDRATHNEGVVQLGDGAPVFAPACADQHTRDGGVREELAEPPHLRMNGFR
jgi:hypothetical protein